jgi:Flp pilus assembly protein TadG
MRNEAGAALYELALVLPLLAMVLSGVIWGGITFYDYVVLEDAVAAGARVLATSSGATNACTVAIAAVQTAAASLNPNYLTVPTPTFGTSSCTNLAEGDYGTVTATYACNLTIPFAGINLCPVVVKTGAGTTGCATQAGSFICSQTTIRIE